MDKKITIRLATPADKPEWLRMRQALWPDEDVAEDLDEMLADPNSPVFLATRPGGGLCGFLEAGIRKYADGCDSGPVGYIEGWYVDADLRGQGVGAALVRAAEDWARGRGFTEMGSDTWLSNEGSIQAHLKLGYKDNERLVHFGKKL